MDNITKIIKVGKVSSVNVEKRTARVVFEDEEDLVSGELPVIINHPLIKVTKKDNGAEWDGEGAYNSEPRNLGKDTYKKALPDTVELNKIITYAGEKHTHDTKIEIHPWLPYVGQWVVCGFSSNGNGDGFVLGGF